MLTRRPPIHLVAFLVLLDLCASPHAARANDKWIQIGNGVYNDKASAHHESGRLVQVSRAWDNAQGRHVLWAGASHGGLWKAIVNESGDLVSWVPVSDTFPMHTMGSFAVMKGDSNNIVIGTGSVGWGPLGDGIYYTTTGGSDWHAAETPSKADNVSRIVADRSDSTGKTLIAATSDGIWRSTDFGKRWVSQLSGVGATDVVQDTGEPKRWYAGVANKGIYLSIDRGMAWKPHGTGITGKIQRISLAACAADSNYLYALVVDNLNKLNGVYRSGSRGLKWDSIYSDDTTINPDAQGEHTCAIGCDPTDAAHIFVGLVNCVEITNAKTADPPNVNPKATVIDGGHSDYNFMFFSEDGNALHIANDGGYYFYDVVHHTVNGNANLLGLNNLELGGSKTGLKTGSPLQSGLASSYLQPDVFVAGLQDDGVVVGNIGAAHEITFEQKGDGRNVSIMPANARVMGFASNGSSIRNLSYDGGETAVGVDFDLTPEKSCPVLIDPTPGLERPFVFTADQFDVPYFNAVYYDATCAQGFPDDCSPDPRWTSVGLFGEVIPGPNVISNVDVTVNPDVYEIVATVAGDDRVWAFHGFRDQLGALTLHEISPPRPSNPINADAKINADRSVYQPDTLYYTSGIGYYTGGEKQIRLAYVSRVQIEGALWTDVTGDIASVSDNADLLKLIGNPAIETELFLATSKGVFRSEDGGAHWKDYSAGLRYHEVVDDIVINFDNVPGKPTLYIATHGRGFWRRTID